MSAGKKAAVAAGVGLAFFAGVGIGVGSGSESVAAATPPAVTVTEEVVKRVEVPLEVTPPGCVLALEKADAMIATAAEGFGLTSEAFDAVSNLDVPALEEANAKMADLGPKMEAAGDAYRTAKGDCQ